ncbi:MAG: DNA primase [Candidatus Levybacteria bacterium]|nr:DNA primase [Candidatus Levybacteria bacterium]
MDQVAQIREKIDIVSFLAEYMTVSKAGRNFRALCPFHNEKSPSFMISPERQVWHCFGCGKGGDIYTFLMDYEHIEFPEALRVLAKRAGVELIESKAQAGMSSKKERLYSLNALAAEYYHYILTKHKVGGKAREYLLERGLSEKIINTFQLGFAPNTKTSLTTYLIRKKKYTIEDLAEAGLIFQRGRDAIDFFRGRLMFPLVDHRDNVVGFSGRVLDKDVKTSKYINTRETLIYHKGEGFYGLNITKDAIRKAGQAILMEGEFDVISSFQEGVSNVIAVKGTALTPEQVNLIGRYAQKISFCFDGDKAGQDAIKRSLPLVEKKNLKATIILLPNGKDPDDAIKQNPTGYKLAVKKDIGVYDYLFDQALLSGDIASAEGKKAVADAFLPVIASMTNEIIKEHYLRKLSLSLETTYESISKELERQQKAVLKEKVPTPPPPIRKQSREEMLEDYLISLIMQFQAPNAALEKIFSILSPTNESEKAYQKILIHMVEYFKKHEAFDQKLFSGSLPPELVFSYNKSLLFPLPPLLTSEAYLREIEKVARQIRELYLRERLKIVGADLAKKEKEEDNEAVEALTKEYGLLMGLLKKGNQ